MSALLLLAVLLGLSAAAYQAGRRRALATVGGNARKLHSLPAYHGVYLALWSGLPALLLLALWLALGDRMVEQLLVADLPAESRGLPDAELDLLLNDVKNVAATGATAGTSGLVAAAAARYNEYRQGSRLLLFIVALAVVAAGGLLGFRRIAAGMPAIHRVERVVRAMLFVGSLIAVLTTLGIVLSLLFEAIRFFRLVSLVEFLFGLQWSPQTAMRADQVGSSGAFGAVPLFTGTLLISLIAMAVAVPVGLFSAIFMAEYARPRARNLLKPLLEILAGIPTVVYGFFAALTVAPVLRSLGEAVGLDVASESALAAGLVMGVMIIPFVSSLSDDVINAVPRGLREASYGLGATKAETITRVVLPAALPGIVGSVLLAISRAIGETMIVVMAAGLAANLTLDPLDSVTTVTAQIVTLLVGDQEFDSAKTLSAFALGLVLFVVTLVFNVIALSVVRRYREQYE
jgi:phosphate transport system permease protein